MVYYGLAVEATLTADVCGQHIIPLRLDDGTATTAAADNLRYGALCVRGQRRHVLTPVSPFYRVRARQGVEGASSQAHSVRLVSVDV